MYTEQVVPVPVTLFLALAAIPAGIVAYSYFSVEAKRRRTARLMPSLAAVLLWEKLTPSQQQILRHRSFGTRWDVCLGEVTHRTPDSYFLQRWYPEEILKARDWFMQHRQQAPWREAEDMQFERLKCYALASAVDNRKPRPRKTTLWDHLLNP